MHVIGVDAGGTKTIALLADARGQIVAQGRGAGANLPVAGELEVEKVLHAVMEDVLDHAAIVPDAICVGIAGVDRDDQLQTVHAIMRRISRTSRVLVVNDALIALVAGAQDSPGIVVISGTGSIVYGRNARNEAARAGGWGPIIGDEGSGFWIGREVLAAVMRAADGRGPATRLTAEVFARFGVRTAEELVQVVYGSGLARTEVAALAPLVQRAVVDRDPVALRILERAADELARGAAAVAERLEMRGDPFQFVLAGGIFHVVPELVDELTRRLVEIAPRAQARPLDVEPALGAVHLALQHARAQVRVPRYK